MTDQPLEDNEFLTHLDMGYIGYTEPQIHFSKDTEPGWVSGARFKASKELGIPIDEIGDPLDSDNDPASPEQAWA